MEDIVMEIDNLSEEIMEDSFENVEGGCIGGLDEIVIEDRLGGQNGDNTGDGLEIESEEDLNGFDDIVETETEGPVGNPYLTPIKTVETTQTVVASNQVNVVKVVDPPREGMVFKSWQAVEAYYKDYAEQQGFGVTRVQGVNSKIDKKKRIATTWRCECWGRPDMRAAREAKKRSKAMEISGPTTSVGGEVCDDESRKGKRTSKKCLCKAKVYASLNGDGDWELKIVELKHSGHDPTPRKSKLVKEYRMKELTSNVKRKLFSFFEEGVSISHIHGCMDAERNGELKLTVKDLEHEVYKARRLKMVGGDAVSMMDYFQKMQAGNSNFYYAQRLDILGRLKDVLWVDARSRAAYDDFGDLVCFDATYLTNEYELPFVNFVGVNHHGQSLLLGCALVSHEDCDTFSWIFRQWLHCMNNRAPEAILTDQAATMRRPLAEIMPHTRHRWCIWHILSKIPDKLGKRARYHEFKNVIKRVVYESFTPAEFHSRWAEMLYEYELEDDEWLLNLHKESHMWVPAYMTEFFWAGMKTTQRVESINRFFDGFVNRHTKLHEFPVKYSRAMKKRVRDEVNADVRGAKYLRRLVSGFRVEKLFQKIYTDNKFQEVQTECARMGYCYVLDTKKISETLMEYVLEDRVWIVPEGTSKEVITDYRRLYSVKFSTDVKEVSCDCRKFETHGILCKHCIRILDQNKVFDIPEKYILTRWRKDIPRKHTRVKVPYYDPCDDAAVQRFNKMMNTFEPICDAAAMINDDTIDMVISTLSQLSSEVNERSRKKRAEPLPFFDGQVIAAPTPSSVNMHSSAPQGDTPDTPEDGQRPQLEEMPTVGDIPVCHDSAEPVAIKDPPIRKKARGRPKGSRHKTLAEMGYKLPKSKKAASVHQPDEDDLSLGADHDQSKLKGAKVSKKKNPGRKPKTPNANPSKTAKAPKKKAASKSEQVLANNAKSSNYPRSTRVKRRRVAIDAEESCSDVSFEF